jgi:hypothetical protein
MRWLDLLAVNMAAAAHARMPKLGQLQVLARLANIFAQRSNILATLSAGGWGKDCDEL